MYRTICVLCLLAASAATPALAEPFNAQAFHEASCTACHDSGVYTRENRRVDSMTRLESQVRMCDANLKTGLFDDDIAALVEHLNTAYYKFPR